MTTSITNEYTSLYKSLTLYFRKGYVCCVWEMSGDKDGLLYWPKFFLALSSTSFGSWLGLRKPGVTENPKPSVCKLVHTSASCLQQTRTAGHLVILFSNIHLLLLFFRLFTQVHLLTDGSVEGQYIIKTSHKIIIGILKVCSLSLSFSLSLSLDIYTRCMQCFQTFFV